MRSLLTHLRGVLLCFVLFTIPLQALAGPPQARDTRPKDLDDLGGRFEAMIDGHRVALPLLRAELEADVKGDLATVTVRQTFANPSTVPMHATYLFPLNEDAAVYEMVMQVGDERVRAKIQEIEEAKKTFETAKSEGKSAALLQQHRPNMFTQDVANLMPGLPVSVTLKYVQTVPRIDGGYSLVLPLVVGPRYQPRGSGIAPGGAGGTPGAGITGVGVADAGAADPGAADPGAPADLQAKPPAAQGKRQKGFGQWQVEALPVYPLVKGLDIPAHIDAERVSIKVRIDAGMPVQKVESDTHIIYTRRLAPERFEVSLAEGKVIDNRDFELRYRLSGPSTQAGLLAYRDTRGGFFSLMLEPPALPPAADITPRELVFLLDCSGSMDGLPMEASKGFMRRALKRLRPSDSFRVIRFSDRATEFSSQPLPATPENVRRALAYTDSLTGEGGTEMTSGVVQALSVPVPKGSLRLVVFLTDGYIGNEHEVLGLIHAKLGDARLFALGVGNGVNRYLLSQMGKIGRGFTRFMTVDEDPEAVAEELAAKLDAPVLTDLRIDWGGLKPADLSPVSVPDLFAGQSVRIQGRYAVPGTYQVTVHGLIRGKPASLPLEVKMPHNSSDGEAVALVWARSAITQAMDRLLLTGRGAPTGPESDAVKRYVTELGLKFALVTQWTAFVAVSERVVNRRPEDAVASAVPLPMVDGVGENAYGERTSIQGGAPGAASSFSGGSTPEPTLIGGLIVAACAGVAALRRRKEDDDEQA